MFCMLATWLARILAVIVAVIPVLFMLVSHQLRQLHELDCSNVALGSASECGTRGRAPSLWIPGKFERHGHLSHVLNVFERLGYVLGSGSDFMVMWSHEYPFSKYRDELKKLKPGQKVNHFPGSGFITSKVELATSGLSYVPPAFKIPAQVDALQRYASEHTGKKFVQKSNAHRNIRIKTTTELDLSMNDTFVQEFVHNPLLIDGYKFDIGVYVVLTSVDPLRVYAYWGDVLLRFCAEKYHPFDVEILDKYVVGDNYLPVWSIPSLKYYHDVLALGHRGSLDAYINDLGLNASRVWHHVDNAIRETYLLKETAIQRAVSARYPQRDMQGYFFEMVRFDFMLDEALNVYLLEANMSPNLSSRHFSQNRLLYEQVMYSLLSVTGIGRRIDRTLGQVRSGPTADMQLAMQQLAVEGQLCGSSECQRFTNASSEACDGVCRVCMPCLSRGHRRMLMDAASEHLNRHLCRRLLPVVDGSTSSDLHLANGQSTPNNQLMHAWFSAKCAEDRSWC